MSGTHRVRVARGRSLLGAACAALFAATLALAPAPAHAAPPEPDFVFTPTPPPIIDPNNPPDIVPPPTGFLNGPCGLAVDSTGRYYVSDYYHDAVDVFFGQTYVTQIPDVDPLDGPCGMDVDAADNLYVNVYHRSVVKYGSFGSFGSGTLLTTLDVDHPTGVAVEKVSGDVYVNERDRIDVYDSAGTLTGSIGAGTLGDGYGLAVSGYSGPDPPSTFGDIYVADAATDTVKVYDSGGALVDELNGFQTPAGGFVSLRDAEIDVDDQTGEVYVIDNLQPELTELPEGIVHVFDAADQYSGHLKYGIVHGEPSGLAVDNSGGSDQSRVYVTSGNTDRGTIYAYPPGSATMDAPVPATSSLSAGDESDSGDGGGVAVGGAALTQAAGTSFDPAPAGASAPPSTSAPGATVSLRRAILRKRRAIVRRRALRRRRAILRRRAVMRRRRAVRVRRLRAARRHSARRRHAGTARR